MLFALAFYQDALLQKCHRTVYAASILTTCLKSMQNIPTPEDYGWRKAGSDSWKPVWTLSDEASKACRELLKCGCKSGPLLCESRRCKCSAAGLPAPYCVIVAVCVRIKNVRSSLGYKMLMLKRGEAGKGGRWAKGPSMIFLLWGVVWNINDVIAMNCQYVYTKNLIYLYESLDKFMWFLLKIHCFVCYIILPLFSSHCFSQEITLGRDNWAKGARAKGARPFQYKAHTAWPPLPAKFQWVHVSQKNPSKLKYIVYYLELCPTKHVTIYIKWKVFFIYVLLSSLRCTHLCIKIKKVPKVWVTPFAQCAGPLFPSYWAKGATLRANLFGL